VKLTDDTDSKTVGIKVVTLAAPAGKIHKVADLIFYGEAGSNNYFGSYLAVGGDVNGDGYKDILVSSKGYPNGASKGRAYLYFGGKNMTGNPDKTFTGENNGDLFSDGICQMADLNNDGFDDLLVGAPEYNGAGRLYIFYGGKDMDEVADVVIDAPDGAGSYFGFRPAVGDINNDGILDLVVCSPMYNSRTGRVYLYYGPISSDDKADKVFTGESKGDTFGMFAIPDGDIDNDGCDDLVIATRYYSSEVGRAYLYWGAEGTSMDEVCDLVFSDEVREQFSCGIEVCDIDKDGFADIMIGSQGDKSAQRGVWLYWGSKRGNFDNTADLVFTGEKNSDNFGNSISVGYANDDQYPDIMINAWNYRGGLGRSYLYYGGTRKKIDNVADHMFDTLEDIEPFQTHIVDVNKDGYGDVVRGGCKYKDFQGRGYLWYGPFHDSTNITFNWDTTNASVGKHTLKAEIAPVEREVEVKNNSVTAIIEVKEK
jgi:hypothetical protein